MSDASVSRKSGRSRMPDTKDRLFKIKREHGNPLAQILMTPSYRAIERILLLKAMDQLYQDTLAHEGDGDFLNKLLEEMNVSYEVSDSDMARFPASGPVVVVANHPYGGIEAVILCVLLKSVRPDAKVMANFLLRRIPEVSDYCIFVDPFKGKKSRGRNLGPLREIRRLLNSGGMLGVFPAGEVAHFKWRNPGVMDPPWDASVGRIIRSSGATVVPLFFEGHNGPVFQLAGLIHPRIRTALLPRELANKRNRSIRLAVGNPILPNEIAKYPDDADAMDFLRFRTYMLSNRGQAVKELLRRRPKRRAKPCDEEIAAPVNPTLMQAEISQLAAEQKVVSSGDLDGYVAPAEQIRHILHEIGRLREITFRAAQEGTGRSRDLDRFDEHYLHLFVWNREKHEVVGSYRIGQADVILDRIGKRGLYTSTLFRYKKSMINRISPALELGRSFVRPEYQRNYSSLLLLWKGLARYVWLNPKYRRLFGPVSISSEYASASRWLLARFFKVNNFEPNLARMIKAKHPLRRKRIRGCAPTIFERGIRDLDAIAKVVSEIEGGDRDVPILLKQYLRLGGKLLGFNLDPDFGNVLDGLILVDLAATELKQLAKFMGRKEAVEFMNYHGVTTQ